MADVESISNRLANSLRLTGWSFWVDTSKGEPFQAWLTPPGVPGWTREKYISNIAMVSELDAFNDPTERLTIEETLEVADKFFNKWFLDVVCARVSNDLGLRSEN